MLLVVDVGNTNIVIGGYREDLLLFTARVATERSTEPDQFAIQMRALLDLHHMLDEPIDAIVISSVVPALSGVLVQAFSYITSASPHLVTIEDAACCGVTVDIDNPAELGTDILVSTIAVRHNRPLPAVVIDLGTATKLTALDEYGHLRGVSIAPGLFISLNALISGASMLSGIPLDAPLTVIGRNSPDSIKSGVLLGAASMLDGMLDRFAGELGSLKTVVATGGGAKMVVPHCRHNIELNENLLLEGMMMVYRRMNT